MKLTDGCSGVGILRLRAMDLVFFFWPEAALMGGPKLAHLPCYCYVAW